MQIQLKEKWGGLVETVYSQPDGISHDNEYLTALVRMLSHIEQSSTYTLYNNLELFSKKDCDFLCSPLLDTLKKLTVERAAEDNNMEAVKFLVERKICPSGTDRGLAWACAHENTEMIKYLLPLYRVEPFETLSFSVRTAAEMCVNYDRLESLKILVAHYNTKCISETVIKYAILGNNLKFMEYIHSIFPSGISSLISSVIRNNSPALLSQRDNVDTVRFLISKGHLVTSIPKWTEDAVICGLFKTFKYLASVNPDVRNSVKIAIAYNDMRIIKYIIEEMKQPITTEYMASAIDNNSEICVQYFLEKKAPNIEESLVHAVKGQKRKLAELLRLELCKKSYV